MKEQTERRQSDFPEIWQKIGAHEEAINTLKSNDVQVEQKFVGHRAETISMVQGLELKMEAAWDSISIKLNTLQKFQWTILIGGAVVATMIVGEIIMAWQILINHDSLMWIWKK